MCNLYLHHIIARTISLGRVLQSFNRWRNKQCQKMLVNVYPVYTRTDSQFKHLRLIIFADIVFIHIKYKKVLTLKYCYYSYDEWLFIPILGNYYIFLD